MLHSGPSRGTAARETLKPGERVDVSSTCRAFAGRFTYFRVISWVSFSVSTAQAAPLERGPIPGSSIEQARATGSDLFSFLLVARRCLCRCRVIGSATTELLADGIDEEAAGGHWPERAGCLGERVAGIRRSARCRRRRR